MKNVFYVILVFLLCIVLFSVFFLGEDLSAKYEEYKTTDIADRTSVIFPLIESTFDWSTGLVDTFDTVVDSIVGVTEKITNSLKEAILGFYEFFKNAIYPSDKTS